MSVKKLSGSAYGVRRKNAIRDSMADLLFKIIIGFILTGVSLITLLPVVNVLFHSLTPTAEAVKYPNAILRWPTNPTLFNFEYILQGGNMLHAALISVSRTTLGTFLCLVLSALTAYPLSKRTLPGGNALMFIFFFSMVFIPGMIPTYLAVRNYNLLDSFWAMIFPIAMNTYNMIILRTFFHAFPTELEESAKIDGCGDLRIMIQIVFPLSMPAFASIGLFYAVQHWNSWFDAVMYIRSRELWPLQLYLREIISNANVVDIGLDNQSADTIRPTARLAMSAMIIFTALPIMCVYPFLQKHFVKGVMIGSVKG